MSDSSSSSSSSSSLTVAPATSTTTTNKRDAPNLSITPCTPSCGEHAQSTPLTDYLLLSILPLLPTESLLRLRSVSRHWHTLIATRRILRSATFTHPPDASLILESFELHPVFRKLDYWGYYPQPRASPPLEERAEVRGRRIMEEVVGEAMCSRPAVKEVGVWLCGEVHVIRQEEGVKVKDLVRGFDEVIQKQRQSVNKRFEWDYKTYPFAGFRILEKLSNMSEARLVVTPEFFDTAAIVAELREGRWTKNSVGVPFCFELPE